MKARIAVLPGDGIGPEVTDAALRVLEHVADHTGHSFETQTYPVGGTAIDTHADPLPGETLAGCLTADAVLFGAVGGPRWDDPLAAVRPEQALLRLRKSLGLYANLRPVRLHPDLVDASPIRPERLAGVDLLVVRELTGGIYFGEPRRRFEVDGEAQAVDTMHYAEHEIRRVAELAFRLAAGRRGKVSSVDKANVLETSRLWRQTVIEVHGAYPSVELEHVLVDAAAMHLITRPADFDVIVTGNLFGDILSDEASVLSGSMGNMPSASLGDVENRFGQPRGMYEPIHGSAPDIAGRGIANPIGMILSLAMLLRHSLGLEAEAERIEAAVDAALSGGTRTADLARPGEASLGTDGMTAAVLSKLSDH